MATQLDNQTVLSSVTAVFSLIGAVTGAGVVVYESRYSESHLDKATNVAIYLPGAVASVAASVFLSIAFTKIIKRDFALIITHYLLVSASMFAPYFAGSLHTDLIKNKLSLALQDVPTQYIRPVFGAIGAATTLLITTALSRILTGSFAVTKTHIGLALAVAFLYSRLNKPDFGPALDWLVDYRLRGMDISSTMPGWIQALAGRFPEEFGAALGRLQKKNEFNRLQPHLNRINKFLVHHIINKLALDGEKSKKFGRGYALALDDVYRSIIKPGRHPMVQLENILTAGKSQELCGHRIVEALALTLAFEPKVIVVAERANHLSKELIHQICIWLKPTDIVQLSMTIKWHYRCIAGAEGLPMWNAKKVDLMREIFLSEATGNMRWIQEALVVACPEDLLSRLKDDTEESLLLIRSQVAADPEHFTNPENLKVLSKQTWEHLARFGLPETALIPFCAGIRKLHENHYVEITRDMMIKPLKRIQADNPHIQFVGKISGDFIY
jgi:hypothetical protein